MKSAEASDHNQKCQDVIAVLSLQDKHPLPEGQAAALIVGVLEMSKTASFRAWFCQSVDAATTRGVVHTLATHTDRRQDALAALRNLCACGEAVQNCVIDELDTLTSKEGANVSVLVLQVLANAVVQNASAAQRVAVWLDTLSVDAVSKENHVVLAALLHNVRCWHGESAAEQVLLPPLVSFYEGDDRHDVWFAGLAAFSKLAFAELEELFVRRPRVLLLAMKQFRNQLPWHRHVDFVARHVLSHLELVAMLLVDESEEGRAGCATLAKQHGVIEKMKTLLQDKEAVDCAHALQLVGNVVYRNEAEVAGQLLTLNMLPRILELTQFDPERPFAREWAMVVVRNAVEADPRVHEYLSAMQMLDIARDNPQNMDIERRTGARLELVEGKPMLVRREEQ